MYSIMYRSEDLECLIEKHPLTKEEADYIFNDIKGVDFTNEIAAAALLLIKKDGKYYMKIRKSDSEEEKTKSVIHEILHIDYIADGKAEGVEHILDEETERIYKEHPRFAKYLFERAKNIAS